MKLERVDFLIAQRALIRQQLIEGSLESEKARCVGAQANVDANGSDGRLVANAEADALHHVSEILIVALAKAEADVAHVVIDVAHIVKQYAADVIAEQRKAQFRRMNQQSVAAQRKSSFEIARPGLVIGERAVGRRAAGEEA